MSKQSSKKSILEKIWEFCKGDSKYPSLLEVIIARRRAEKLTKNENNTVERQRRFHLNSRKIDMYNLIQFNYPQYSDIAKIELEILSKIRY